MWGDPIFVPRYAVAVPGGASPHFFWAMQALLLGEAQIFDCAHIGSSKVVCRHKGASAANSYHLSQHFVLGMLRGALHAFAGILAFALLKRSGRHRLHVLWRITCASSHPPSLRTLMHLVVLSYSSIATSLSCFLVAVFAPIVMVARLAR